MAMESFRARLGTLAIIVVALALYVSAASVDFTEKKTVTVTETEVGKNDVTGIQSKQPTFQLIPHDNSEGNKAENNAGARDRKIKPKIISGEEAAVGEFPFQISIQAVSFVGGNWHHICGGSIISETKILTAAHCVRGEYPNRLRIVAGAHNIFEYDGNEQVRNVSSYIYNTLYNSSTLNYDIAVITVNRPFIYNARVQPIKIAVAHIDATGECVTSGWGLTDPNDAHSDPDKLQKTSLDAISRDDCRQRYMGVNEITTAMTCATRPGGHGSCNGDSGGPLVCTNSAGIYLAGIVSWGISPCGQDLYPTVFANMAHFVEWTEEYAQ